MKPKIIRDTTWVPLLGKYGTVRAEVPEGKLALWSTAQEKFHWLIYSANSLDDFTGLTPKVITCTFAEVYGCVVERLDSLEVIAKGSWRIDRSYEDYRVYTPYSSSRLDIATGELYLLKGRGDILLEEDLLKTLRFIRRITKVKGLPKVIGVCYKGDYILDRYKAFGFKVLKEVPIPNHTRALYNFEIPL